MEPCLAAVALYLKEDIVNLVDSVERFSVVYNLFCVLGVCLDGLAVYFDFVRVRVRFSQMSVF